MKTSNYILTGFLVFFFGSILALHIDSKLYEEEGKKLNIERKILLEAYYEFLEKENWNNYISKVDNYYSKTNSNSYDPSYYIGKIYDGYKKHNDTPALTKAKKLVELALEENKNDVSLNKLYAAVLFDLGYVEKAIKHQEFVFKNYLKRSPKKRKSNSEILNRYKNKLNYKKIEKGDKFIDVTLTASDNEKHQLSNLVKNKVTLLSFWSINDTTSIAKQRSLLPIYNKYKELQIIGINDIYSLENLIQKRFTTSDLYYSKGLLKQGSEYSRIVEAYKFPWKNYFDENYKEYVWDKYDIITKNFGFILIDKSGTIVSFNPTIEELQKELNQLFKN